MTALKPLPGLVICYSYLWYDEAEAGQEEGVKDRPCAIIVVAEEADGDTVVRVAPITHASPHDPAAAVEIPPATKKRLGLDDARSWVVVSETNLFAWPGPDLRPIHRKQPGKFDYGFLPPSLFEKIRVRMLDQVRSREHRTAKRTI